MGTLIRYELKKIIGNRAGMAGCAIVLAMLAAMAVLNLTSMTVRDYATGEVSSGFAAQGTWKANEQRHAGLLDDAHIAADLAAYDRALELQREHPELGEMPNQQVIDTMGLDFWREARVPLHDAYYTRLTNVLELGDGTWASSLQEGALDLNERVFDIGYVGYFPYTQAERDYWRAREADVSWPVEYGAVGGWGNVFDWMSFFGLVIVAACIAVSGVFAGEYRDRTAAVALPTRRGKGILPMAKALAALAFTTVYWWLCVAVITAIYLGVCGADGANLPLQVLDFASPYALTVGQACAFVFAIGYVMALGAVGFTLLLSAKLRSTMPVAVIPLAVTFLGVLGAFFTPFTKVVQPTPFMALNKMYVDMTSYAAGSVVMDLPTLVLVLYAALLVVCTPLAARAFRRHQVA